MDKSRGFTLLLVKKACILANVQLGKLPEKKATPLLEATEEVLSGAHY
jgi:fumarate hydratase class II